MTEKGFPGASSDSRRRRSESRDRSWSRAWAARSNCWAWMASSFCPRRAADAPVEVVELGGRRPAVDAHAAPRLVDEVDGLVGEVAVGDVAVGQVGRGDQGGVGVARPVVGLVLLPQALEDLDGLGHRGLVDLHRLEAALQGGVLLEVLAVLLEGGGPHRLQLSPSQHGLQDAGGVDGPLGRPRPHQGVDLVDEQHDVAPGADLLQHLLEALLEVAAVPGAGHQGPQVEGVDLLALEGLGDLAGDDALRQALDDGRLAHPGLAHQHRVVLGPAGEDLHDPVDLPLPADDRVELALPGVLGEVAAELVEHRGPAAALLGGAAALGPAAAPPTRGGFLPTGGLFGVRAGEKLDDRLAHLVQFGPELLQHLGGHALALADQAEEDVLGADVVVAQLQGLAQRQLEDLLGSRGEGDVAAGGLRPLADDLHHLGAHRLQADAHAFEGPGGDAFALVDEAEEDVLGADVVVVEQPGLFLGQDHHPAGSVGEPLEQGSQSPDAATALPVPEAPR